MTEELYRKLLPYKEVMKKIVINSAFSTLPIGYQELVLGELKNRGVSLCQCASGVLNATSRLYQELLVYEHGNVKTTKSRRSSRPNKE